MDTIKREKSSWNSIIQQLPSDHKRLAKLCEEFPDARELVQTNPALALCIACANTWDTLRDKRSPGLINDLLHSKRRHVCDVLGFPGTESTVKIMSKITPEACDISRLKRLRTVLKRKNIENLLRHTPIITLGTMVVVLKWWRSGALTVGLVQELGHLLNERNVKPDELTSYQAMAHMKDTLRMFRMINMPVRPMKSMEEMEALHGRLVLTINTAFPNPEEGTDGDVDLITMPKEFPPPPLPGNSWIHPLTTPEMLIKEGREQNNCVASLIDEVACGGIYVYKITWPERATVSIKQFTGEWVVEQIETAENEPVAKGTIRKVEEWLYGCYLGFSEVDEDPEKLEMPHVLTTSEREECVKTAKELLSQERYFTGPEMVVLETVIEGELFNLQRLREIAMNHGAGLN